MARNERQAARTKQKAGGVLVGRRPRCSSSAHALSRLQVRRASGPLRAVSMLQPRVVFLSANLKL